MNCDTYQRRHKDCDEGTRMMRVSLQRGVECCEKPRVYRRARHLEVVFRVLRVERRRGGTERRSEVCLLEARRCECRVAGRRKVGEEGGQEWVAPVLGGRCQERKGVSIEGLLRNGRDLEAGEGGSRVIRQGEQRGLRQRLVLHLWGWEMSDRGGWRGMLNNAGGFVETLEGMRQRRDGRDRLVRLLATGPLALLAANRAIGIVCAEAFSMPLSGRKRAATNLGKPLGAPSSASRPRVRSAPSRPDFPRPRAVR